MTTPDFFAQFDKEQRARLPEHLAPSVHRNGEHPRLLELMCRPDEMAFSRTQFVGPHQYYVCFIWRDLTFFTSTTKPISDTRRGQGWLLAVTLCGKGVFVNGNGDASGDPFDLAPDHKEALANWRTSRFIRVPGRSGSARDARPF